MYITICCLRISKVLTTSTKLSFLLKIIWKMQVKLFVRHNLELATKNLKLSDEGLVKPKLKLN